MATETQKLVVDLADCLYSFKISDSYLNDLKNGPGKLFQKCKNAANLMRNPWNTVPFNDHDSGYSGTIDCIRGAANNVVKVSDEIASFISRAANAGFLPPSNPMLEIAKYNSRRSFVASEIVPKEIDKQLAEDILFNLNIFLDFIEKEKEGEINLTQLANERVGRSAQISSYDVSLSGYEMKGSEGAQSLLSFLPDADKIKRMRIRKSLESLNFNNRVPEILFTAKYDPDGLFRGCIVGWRKMHDASGYILERHSVFDNENKRVSFTNKSAADHYSIVKDYVKKWVLSFYDIDEDSIFAFLDTDINGHNLYTYKVKAYQSVRSDSFFMFNVNTSQFVMSPLQIQDIKKSMQKFIDQNLKKKLPDITINDISPYPFIAKKFYGDDKSDWILSALNVKSSKDRNEDRTQTRKLSYLGSSMNSIEDAILDGRFLRPTDVAQVVQNIKESITTFGISTTILSIIEATGLDMYFGAKDSQNSEFERASTTLDIDELSSLKSVLSSIDFETATVDVSVLTENLLSMNESNSQSVTAGNILEVYFPDGSKIDEFTDDDDVQFVGSLNSTKKLDLTTFEGISNFIRLVRLFFDTNPNRSTIASEDVSDELDFDGNEERFEGKKGGKIVTPGGTISERTTEISTMHIKDDGTNLD